MMMFLKELFITLNYFDADDFVFHSDTDDDEIYSIIITMMKKIRLMIYHDDVYGDIRHQIYDVCTTL